jgi:hypothetical protein
MIVISPTAHVCGAVRGSEWRGRNMRDDAKVCGNMCASSPLRDIQKRECDLEDADSAGGEVA